jgi:hypothetical protein
MTEAERLAALRQAEADRRKAIADITAANQRISALKAELRKEQKREQGNE